MQHVTSFPPFDDIQTLSGHVFKSHMPPDIISMRDGALEVLTTTVVAYSRHSQVLGCDSCEHAQSQGLWSTQDLALHLGE